MERFFDQLLVTVGSFLPAIIGAFLILIIGWLIALGISALIRTILKHTSFDNKMFEKLGLGKEKTVKSEIIISRTIFYILMLFVLIAFFQVLGLTIITEPLNRLLSIIFAYLPNILGAVLLLFLAWLIASAVKIVISKTLNATRLDDKLTKQAGFEEKQNISVSDTLANVAYWFVLLLFLPAILGTLGLQGLLAPVSNMVNEILLFIPNIFAAALILFLGWLVAKIIRQIVTGLLIASGVDNIGMKAGIGKEDSPSLSKIIGIIVYILILIPAIIAALNALNIEAVSRPGIQMLTLILNSIPLIFGAMVILTLTYIIGKILQSLVSGILTSIGFNKVLKLIGIGKEPTKEELTPADLIGYLVLIGLMLFATIEAANLLGFTIVATLVSQFLYFASQVLLGIIIFGIGLYLANLAEKIIMSTANVYPVILARFAKVTIIFLVTAMALRETGIAEDIINLAFGLLLGAIAVAVAIAFGFGSRDIAGKEVEKWVQDLRERREQ
jgi:hypothetical protein